MPLKSRPATVETAAREARSHLPAAAPLAGVRGQIPDGADRVIWASADVSLFATRPLFANPAPIRHPGLDPGSRFSCNPAPKRQRNPGSSLS
ncbi:hypothetical protein SJA_C1-33730 [Sphingobium indicum UT26S]|uniref:Uncharacterized protein n=1 Tax=Sphingobium indicum (strain DSM 16413 / CCM 7287 / MTCC 6362 / UT26 / NBRC 101211 / UT26S) TaxID=452662 RepID=D4Z6H5_SPHIU|nr:hypothetical protein SJA_C1-33730 [Sphingobium indicum UT26S]